MSDRLFKSLSKLHKLDSEWRIYLDAAAILRNVGEAVSVVGNGEHSSYIVRNANFPFFEEWETELVSQLCLNHERFKIDQKTVPFSGVRRAGFLKILAMLCVIDALDIDTRSPVTIERVSSKNGEVNLVISGGTQTDLELFRVDQRRPIFESVFRKSIRAQRS
jgi:exopolyphosphatase/guanosine-5'-triphosphate,3'-diphosphate pyrophosphatase